MRIKDYPLVLELLVNQRNGIEEFLEGGSKNILINRARSLKSTIKRGRTWRFSIPIDHPLMFIKNNSQLQVDISCEIEGRGDIITKQNIILRLWSFDKNLCSREEIDSTELKVKLDHNNCKRVMLRFHFDFKEPNGKQLEPKYHFHVGGRCRTDDENCWLPEQIDIPRFPCPPMDLILICEFLLINFFPKESEQLRKKPEWQSLVRKSQDLFLKPYYDICTKKYLKDQNETLLGNLVAPLKGV